MSTPFVRFPGTNGNYIDTDGVNLINADQAHMIQGQPWGGFHGAIVDDGAQADGFGQLTITVADVGARLQETLNLAVTNGQITLSANVKNLQGTDRTMRIRIVDNGTSSFSDSVSLPAGADTRVSATFAAIVGPITQLWFYFGSDWNPTTNVGDEFEFSKVCLVQGSVGTFVPSLNIVGDLDIRAKLALDDWTPAANTIFVDNLSGTDGYQLLVLTTGGLVGYHGDGSDNRSAFSNVLGLTDGSAYELKYTMNNTTGDGKFYVDDVLDSTDNEATGDASPSGLGLTVGATLAGTSPLDGDLYWAEIRDGIGGPVVARMDAADVAGAV